jgi:hypothetical protein
VYVSAVRGRIVATMSNSNRTPERAIAFCAALAETCNVGKACAAIGIGRTTAYDWRDADPDFAAMWDRAVKIGVTALADEAHRRAFDGVAEPVVHKGEFSYEWEVARDETGDVIREEDGRPKMVPALDADGRPRLKTIQRYSDVLAMFLLKAHDSKYRDSSKLELAGALELRNVPDEELEAEIAALAALVGHNALAGAAPAVDPDDASDLV